jgi:deoxyribodipyrimidine photo-lyase
MKRLAQLEAAREAGEPVDPRWFASLRSFRSRLRWHCHFMQKLEDEPAIERVELCRAYEGLRDVVPDAERLAAFAEGRTGYPFVDACLRSAAATGWLTFRMRAMVMSFAAYHLWLDWRPVGDVLARWWTDYEPGIHWPQCQMQSGVTGINAIRIYNPVKQALDHDPEGRFTRTWVPELSAVPLDYLHTPHAMPALVRDMCGVVIGRDYPAPIVDNEVAMRSARDRLWAVRRAPGTREAAHATYVRHGSRKEPFRVRPLG